MTFLGVFQIRRSVSSPTTRFPCFPSLYKAKPPGYFIPGGFEIKEKLYHQHGIAVAEEIVLLFHRYIISFDGQVVARKSTYHDQQAGFG